VTCGRVTDKICSVAGLKKFKFLTRSREVWNGNPEILREDRRTGTEKMKQKNLRSSTRSSVEFREVRIR
jgi:hypothetical protein